jgi:hypothetical protein
MRYPIFLSICLLLLVACNYTPDEVIEEQEASKEPWTVLELNHERLDLLLEPMEIHQREFRTVPGDVIWPVSDGDFEKMPAWFTDENGDPVIVAADAGDWVDEDHTERGEGNVYRWIWGSDKLEVNPMDPQPPAKVMHPSPYPTNDSSIVGFAEMSVAGLSLSRALRIEDSGPISAPAIDGFFFWNQDGSMKKFMEINQDIFDLDPGITHTPMDRLGLEGLTFRDYRPVEIESSGIDDVVSMSRPWVRIDVDEDEPEMLDGFLQATGTSIFTCYLKQPEWYFQVFWRTSEQEPYTLIYSDDGDLVRLNAIPAEDAESDPMPVNVYNLIPAVHYMDKTIVFCIQDPRFERREGVYTVEFPIPLMAVMFTGDDLLTSNPTVIWESTVYNFFNNCVVIYTGEDHRPYIVGYNQETGNITVFDPLTATIRTMGASRIAPQTDSDPISCLVEGLGLPSDPQYIFIHDPNANTIVKHEILISRTMEEEIRGSDGLAPD